MKKALFLSVLATAGLLADSPETGFLSNSKRASSVPVEISNSVDHQYFNKRLIPYVKLGPEVVNVANTAQVSPYLGFGIRSESYKGAVDVSVSGSALKNGTKRSYQVFFPKIVYHRFISPYSANSFYYGGGASWTKISKLDGYKFTGLAGNISVGYEMSRDSAIRQMVQIDLDQPLLAYKLGAQLPLPSLQVSYSLGF